MSFSAIKTALTGYGFMHDVPFWILLIGTFGHAGLEKIFGGTPEWFIQQFQGSFLNCFPGSLHLLFYFIAILELVTAACVLGGVARREFLPRHLHKRYLRVGAVMAQATFVLLGFGQRFTHQYDGAAHLFFYAALTYLASRAALNQSSTFK